MDTVELVKGSRYGVAIYSPDDGGWYVSIFDQKGRDVRRTAVYPTRDEAMRDAYTPVPHEPETVEG